MTPVRAFELECDPTERDHGVLYDAMNTAACFAIDLIEEEEPLAEAFEGDDIVMPLIPIVDAAGRPIVAVRLDREPGTRDFRIVLLTEAAA